MENHGKLDARDTFPREKCPVTKRIMASHSHKPCG